MIFPTMFVVAALLNPSPLPNSMELARDLRSLQQTGCVLYVAAHPDDENTQLLGYMANSRGWRTAYLSLTRGEGGQNAIGDEFVHPLGVIRTWELLTARSVDGAEQRISRQRDFGYSKSADETLRVWDDAQALGDVVRVIRELRPTVVVTRFPEEGTTHGHHLASAQLARRAFAIAGDPEAYPEQLEGPGALRPWQPSRLLYNVPLRWMGGEIQDEWYTIDLGTFDPILGRSYGEISAMSRSMHRSQAFGRAGRRGPDVEAFEYLAGSVPPGEDPFADLGGTWNERAGGGAMGRLLAAALADFDAMNPAASIPTMIEAHIAASALPASEGQPMMRAIEAWIVGASGLHVDARVESAETTPGATINVTIEALAQASAGWNLQAISIPGLVESDAALPARLGLHEPFAATASVRIPEDAAITTPYWLRESSGTGAYQIADSSWVGRAIGTPALVATLTIGAHGGPSIDVDIPVRALVVEPTLGERVEALRIAPPLELKSTVDVLLLPNGEPAELDIMVSANTDVRGGRVSVDVPDGWSVEPASRVVSLDAGQRSDLRFSVVAPAGATPADIRIVATVGDRQDSWTEQRIDYPHLPPLTIYSPATVRATPLVWNPIDGVIGYIMGPGDGVAAALQGAGLDLRLIDDATLESGDLDEYRAILVGPRAFHERTPLQTNAQRLWDYAERGGVVVVQYQTNNRAQALTQPVGPAPITIGRGRVTVEEAPIEWLAAADSIRNGVHTLSAQDFEGWVQERGLYFAQTWDAAWTPLVSVADPGEEPQTGALLLAEHGEGAVFYTGLSLFRQLPAGVPGGYRLLANMIAYQGAQ